MRVPEAYQRDGVSRRSAPINMSDSPGCSESPGTLRRGEMKEFDGGRCSGMCHATDRWDVTDVHEAALDKHVEAPGVGRGGGWIHFPACSLDVIGVWQRATQFPL